MWTSLEAFMLCRALHAYSKGPIPDSREWVSLVLSFMKLCIDELGMSLVDFQGDVKSQIDDLLESVQKAASQLDPGKLGSRPYVQWLIVVSRIGLS